MKSLVLFQCGLTTALKLNPSNVAPHACLKTEGFKITEGAVVRSGVGFYAGAKEKFKDRKTEQPGRPERLRNQKKRTSVRLALHCWEG